MSEEVKNICEENDNIIVLVKDNISIHMDMDSENLNIDNNMVNDDDYENESNSLLLQNNEILEVNIGSTSSSIRDDDDDDDDELNIQNINTFEEHFKKPEIQHLYKIKLLMFEMWMKICFFLTSLLCSIIAFQKFYRENKDMTRNILLANTTILWILMTALPFTMSKIKKMREYPWLIIKIITDAILRIFQTIIIALWIDLIFVEIWNGYYFENNQEMPFLYMIPAYYALSLIIHLVIILYQLFTKGNLTRWQMCLFSHGFIGLFLLISIDVTITNTNFEPLSWNLGQISLVALFTEIDHLVGICMYEKTTLDLDEKIINVNNSNEPADLNV